MTKTKILFLIAVLIALHIWAMTSASAEEPQKDEEQLDSDLRKVMDKQDNLWLGLSLSRSF